MLSLKKKLKNYALILPLVSFALLQQTLFAQVVSDTPLVKKNFIYTISNSETATLLGYKGSSRTLTLPATLDGYQVTSIAERAFINQSTLRSVIIPSGITNIGNAAFAACANLKNIEVNPENPSYTSVDGVLFSKDLKTLIQCPGSRKGIYNIPEGTEMLDANSFLFCQKLQFISIPEGVTSIGNNAFESTLIPYIEFPESLNTLGHNIFLSCDNLKIICAPKNCKAVVNAKVIGEGEKVNISLWEYNENDSIIALEGYTAGDAFEIKEKNLILKDAELLSDQQGIIYSVKNGKEVSVVGYKYKYPSGRGKKMKASRVRHVSKGLVIPTILEGYPVTKIEEHAFFCADKLEGIAIPSTVTSIENSAFMYCSSITNIVIPQSVTNIGYGAFRHCNNMTNIILGKNILNLGDYAFDGCSNLISVDVPNSILCIKEGVFKNCANLQSVHTGNSLTNIGKVAFEGCTNLRSMTIHENLLTLEETFETCASLEYFNVNPNNPVYSSRDGVLLDHDQTKIIRFPRSIKDTYYDIENEEFISNYIIPMTVTNIGTFAFSRCHTLTNIVIPDSVHKIEPYAFYMCTNLQQAIIPGSITAIPPGAFSRCSSLQSVEMGSGIEHIYSSAFSSCKSLSKLYFCGDAPKNSDGFIDDWHKITIFYQDGTKGWDDFAWRDKSKRIWRKISAIIDEKEEPTDKEAVLGESANKSNVDPSKGEDDKEEGEVVEEEGEELEEGEEVEDDDDDGETEKSQ